MAIKSVKSTYRDLSTTQGILIIGAREFGGHDDDLARGYTYAAIPWHRPIRWVTKVGRS